MAATPQRIPSLDGLRAVSIIAVLLGHLAGTNGLPHAVTAIVRNPYLDIAHLGVRVFFVISGFLITHLLLAEERRHGRISLERFYLRRTLRIFPAYFALLGVFALLAWGGALALTGSDFAHALTYTVNYAPGRSWDIGHLWSLAVEEQFYLVWPAALVLAGTRRARRVVVAALCVVPLIRVAESMLWPAWQPMIGTTFETSSDALAIGCLLALVGEELMAHRWYARALASRGTVPVLLLVAIAASRRYRPSLLIGDTILNVAIALAVHRCVRRADGRAGRLLNAQLFVFVGGLSYSLYLWQQIFLNRTSDAVTSRFPLNITLGVACALVSYYAIERPILTRVRPQVEAWLDRRHQRPVALPPGWQLPTARPVEGAPQHQTTEVGAHGSHA